VQRLARSLLLGVALAALLAGCPGTSAPLNDGGPAADAGGGDAGGGAAPGQAIFARMAGLWSGQAAQTPLGSFPEMSMDFRAEDSNWLFGRVDLDAENNLRYGFAVEDIAGQATVVYRNGGFFQGVLRDLTTQLMDFDDDAGVYHFCAAEQTCMYVDGGCIEEQGGCGFVDALLTFQSATSLVMNAHVNGAEHLIWTATQATPEPLPAPFPSPSTAQPSDASWPTMPQLSVTVSWSTALTAPTGVWVILSTMPCQTFTCTPSRTLTTSAPAGATSATLLFDQIHAGSYDANAVLDIAGTFSTTLTPTTGDGVALPDQSITVPATGQGTASLAIVDYL
jgi:hypothetical protein